MPTLRAVLLHVWDGVWSFVRKAGTTILLTSMVLWALLRFPGSTPPDGLPEAQASSYQMERSIAGRTGKAMEPLFSPLGFEWRTNVAILGSLAAREVFVSTLALTTASQDEDSLPLFRCWRWPMSARFLLDLLSGSSRERSHCSSRRSRRRSTRASVGPGRFVGGEWAPDASTGKHLECACHCGALQQYSGDVSF
jgi:Fe2+ transport system protein B